MKWTQSVLDMVKMLQKEISLPPSFPKSWFQNITKPFISAFGNKNIKAITPTFNVSHRQLEIEHARKCTKIEVKRPKVLTCLGHLSIRTSIPLTLFDSQFSHLKDTDNSKFTPIPMAIRKFKLPKACRIV